MENPVLIQVARDIAGAFVGARLDDVRQEAAHRVRLVFEGSAGGRTLVVSILPELPWIGRPAGPPLGRAPIGAFAATVRRALAGVALARVEKPLAERVVTLRFVNGRSLVAELRSGSANLILLDAAGCVEAAARQPRSAHGRTRAGIPYRGPDPPPGRLDPFAATAEEIDAALESMAGDSLARALGRGLFGVGPAAAGLLGVEVDPSGRDAGSVVAARLAAVADGAVGPVGEAPPGALEAADEGRLDPTPCRLWPWEPLFPAAPGCVRTSGAGAAATAGAHFEAVERALLHRGRMSALRAIVSRESARLRDAEDRAREDLERFSEPDILRRQAEALLAGASRADRRGNAWVVVDPYDPQGAEIAVAGPPGMGLQELARKLFADHRRARRGRDRACERVRELRERGIVLGALGVRLELQPDRAGLATVESELRQAGVAVGLERPPAGGGRSVPSKPPRLEGVRIVTSTDGLTILVGRSGAENDRLTFKLAGPEDFWFHALGRPGAHVVVRNDSRASRPPEATLREAAALAAWFSAARAAGEVDVHWTRRKYVRRARGAPPGTVLVKKAETLRVRTAQPPPGLQRF